MKKIIIIIFSLLLLAGISKAQWSFNGTHIYNTNSGNVGIGNSSPGTLLEVGKSMTEPSITVRNFGGAGGATYSMVDNISGANWKFKATSTGGFKIRDHANLLDVLTIEPNSASNALYIKGGGSIGMGTSSPNNSAILDLQSTNKGFLAPRMTDSQMQAIASPATGLMVYNTGNQAFFSYNGASWEPLSAGSNAWNLNGNAGTNPANHFVGTTDEQALRFKVNNTWAGEIHPTNGNLFFGLGAGQTNTNGQANIAIGEHSLFANTDGNFNAANGYYSLSSNTSGYSNTAHGTYSLTSNDVGHSNTAVGRNSLFGNTSGNFNTATGEGSLLTNITGNNNTANGYQALYSNTIGLDNTSSGYQALYSNSTGSNNTGNGNQVLYSNTTGEYNTASGFKALYFNISGSGNSAFGYQALYSNTATDNVAHGYQALYSNTNGFRNVANGYQALYYNTQGGSNIASGYRALYLNAFGSNNTAIGYDALYSNYTGYSNTALGYDALSNNVGGYKNIAIGVSSGTHTSAGNVYNTISIGNDGLLNGYQNQVIIGNASTGYIGGVVTWSVVSDARIKNTIKEDVKGLDFISRLRPVTYHISQTAITTITGNKETADFPGKYDGEKVKYSGFIAQEVEQAAKDAGYDFSGYAAPKNEWGLYTVSYEQFVVPLVKAVQELDQKNETLEDFVKIQQRSIDILQIQNEQLMLRIEKLETR